MNKTCAEISAIRNCTRQAVKDFLLKNDIKPSGMKGKLKTYDCSLEPLASYVGFLEKEPPETKPVEESKISFPPPKVKTVQKAVQRFAKPLSDLLAGVTKPGQKPAEMLFAEVLKCAKENKDPVLFLKLGQIAAREDADESIRQQAIKTEQAKEKIAQERAERFKIENDIKRGFFMEKDTVKILFGRLFAIHTSILVPLSLKLSSTLAAIPQGDKKEITIKQFIDDEIFAALESIKRLLQKFIHEDSAANNDCGQVDKKAG